MKFVFVSYVNTPAFDRPEDWVSRIKAYLGILHSLSKLGHTVISIDQINYEGEYLSNGVHHYFVNFGNYALYFPWQLHRFVKKLKPDIVVVNGLHFPLQIIQLRLQLGRKIRIIAQNHAEKPFPGIKKYLQLLADHCINAYLFCSKAMGEEWVTKGNIGSLKKIHEVMEVSSEFYLTDKTLAKAKNNISGSPVYLWVGRMNRNKDPLTVVKAFLRFIENWPSARLYMIFQTTELLDEIQKILAGKKNNKDAVILIGKVPHDEMIYWYNSSDFIISGSYYEGSGTAVCEAMSCGCIPILTDILSFRMMTDNGNYGSLYPPGNADALLVLLTNSVLIDINENRNKTLEQFNKTLSFDAIARQFQDIAVSI